MRGRPKPVEEILPEIWHVIEELERLTEGLQQNVNAARAAEKGADDGPDD